MKTEYDPAMENGTGKPWQWLSNAMRTIRACALWTAYPPKPQAERRNKTIPFIPATLGQKAPGIQWDVLTQFLYTQIHSKECQNAEVLVILSDSRAPKDIPHWEFTSRILAERSGFVKMEKFFLIWVPANETTGLAGRHYSWTISAVAAALACNPGLDNKHLLC